jgi:hypothetical protein
MKNEEESFVRKNVNSSSKTLFYNEEQYKNEGLNFPTINCR